MNLFGQVHPSAPSNFNITVTPPYYNTGSGSNISSGNNSVSLYVEGSRAYVSIDGGTPYSFSLIEINSDYIFSCIRTFIEANTKIPKTSTTNYGAGYCVSGCWLFLKTNAQNVTGACIAWDNIEN